MKKRRKRTNSNVPAKGRLRDMADQLWSLAVRTDWNHQCAVCGKRPVEAHHLIPRANYATRFDLWNGIALCANHHNFNPEISPHMNAAGWLNWLEREHDHIHEWYLENLHVQFTGTKTANYFCGEIRRLIQYVDADDVKRIVGVRFSIYLEQGAA